MNATVADGAPTTAGGEYNRCEGAMLHFTDPLLIHPSLAVGGRMRVKNSYIEKSTTPAAIPEILGFDMQSCAIISISTSVGKVPS